VTNDSAGNLYLSEGDTKVRRVDSSGILSTLVGSVYFPHGIAIDAAGNFYVTQSGNRTVLRRDTNGYLSEFAGAGGYVYGVFFNGDEGQASAARLAHPGGTRSRCGRQFVCRRSHQQ
jgi:DNA-binding beta-propeller fold protein YncE